MKFKKCGAVIMVKSILKRVFLALLFGFNPWYGLAQVSTTLQHTDFDSCGANLPQTELNLGNLVLSESLATDFATGTYTFFIQAPSNFEINANTATVTGTDITSINVAQDPSDATRLEITLTASAQASLDAVTLENVRIQLIPSATTTDGNLKYVLDGNPNNLNGPIDNQTLATVSFTALSGGSGVDQEVCAIADVQNISVSGSNISQSRTFEWQVGQSGSWVSISGSDTELLVIDNSTFPNGLSQYRRLTTFTLNGESCTLTSTPATITVNELYPGSITEGANQTVCANTVPDQFSSSGDIAVTPGGVATYQWFKNDTGTWDAISGAIDVFYQPPALSATTSYKRRITNLLNGFSCFEETTPVTVIVNSEVLGGTATDQNICSLSDLQLLTINNGENSGTYQWQKRNAGNWEDIAGATQGTYDASGNIDPGVEEFRRITTVSGANCEGVSTIATITFTNFNEGSINGGETICHNEVPSALSSNTDASGTGTISYQWEEFDGGTWTSIAGANLTTYNPGALLQTTSFRRKDDITLNGFSCSAHTNEITIVVLDEINGGDASPDQTICEGEVPGPITITNGTTAGPNITHQWQSATTGSFTNISGETGTVLNFATAPSVSTRYRRQTTITDNAQVCLEYSTESAVHVNTLIAGVIGDDQDVCAGGAPATIINLGNAVAAGNLTHSWEMSTNSGTTWSVLVAATQATYTPGVLAGTTEYRRLDTSTLNGKVCAVYTNEVTIAVAGAIVGGTGSADQVVCEDEVPTILSVSGGTAAGTGINFQWYASTDNVTYDPIAGEAGETLSFSTPLATSTYFRRNVTSSTNGNVCEASSTPTLVTLLNLSAGTISQTQTVCGGSGAAPITSTADAVSNGAITYTWQRSTDGNTWSDISGTNQATYTPGITTDLETYYRRKATATLSSTSCEVFGLPVIVFVNRFESESSHRITFDSGATGSTTICNGGDPASFGTNFPLIASGALTYQWEVSDDNITYNAIPGATANTYDPPAVTQDSYYRRITTATLNGVECTVTSNVLELINGGNATPGSIGTTNPNGTNGTNEEVICEGDTPSQIVELAPATGQTLSYEWFANNVPIAGETGIDYTPASGITETTVYHRTTYSTDISGVVCAVDSNPVVVLVPNADDIGSDITICSNTVPPVLGDAATIEGSTYLDFQWYESNDGSTFSIIGGATGPTYAPGTPLTAHRFYRRGYVTTVDAIVCGPEELSNTIEVIINDVSGGTILGEQQICFGDDPGLLDNSVGGTASGVLSYQWYSSEDNATWDAIDGAVNNFYDPEAGSFPTTYLKRTTTSELNGVLCSEDSNTITIGVAEEILPGTLASDQTICDGDVPATLTATGGSTFGDQSYHWFSSPDGVVWTDIGVSTASYAPPVPTQTILYKRTITRTSFGSLDCEVETQPITITFNSVNAGKITDNQSVCEGSQPDPMVEVESATGAGTLTYQWWSSPDDQVYAAVPGASQPNYTPPATLTTSTYFKRVVTSSINGVSCTDETSPKLVTVIPYPIIANDAIIANDIAPVSCFGGNDGSIVIPNTRITGGNIAETQINTISLFGSPLLNNTYSIIINGIVYEHEVTLNAINQPQNNGEVAIALAQNINNATGANLSDVIAAANANEIILTAKVAGIGFTSFASTGSDENVSATNVITQANAVANTYEWTKVGDNSFSESTLSIHDLTAGVYQLTVYNEFCGVTSSPFLVAEPELLTLAIGDTCNTAITASSTGGVAPFTFTLTRPDGSTLVQTSNNPNNTYTNLIGGATYTITVEDDSCPIAVSEIVTLPTGLQFDQASVVVENVSCFGRNDGAISLNIGATTVTGGFPPFNFSWTGPGSATYTTENLTDLAPGVYVLEVTDQVGCSATYTANIASKAELTISNVQLINEQLQCAGDTNAEISIQISADPTSQIQIDWLKNGTSFATNSTSLSNLGAGTYEVVVTDTNSDPSSPCTVRQSFTITAPEVFGATKVDTLDPECFDAAGGRTFTFAVQGGTQPYQYSLDGATAVSFNTDQVTVTSLSNDSHVIEVTDANGCVTETFVIPRFEAISYGGIQAYTIAACETNVPFALDTGLVLGGDPYLDSGNLPYYLYDWTGPNGFVAQDITGFDAVQGTYSLTITDSKGCASEIIDFTFSPTYVPIAVDRVITPVSCGVTDDGAISISVSGGNRPYSIVWEKEEAGTGNSSNPVFTPMGQNITQLSGLEVGRIRLTVTSNIPGCSETDPSYYFQEIITINKAESLQLLDGPYLDESLCAGGPGSISVSIFNSQGGDLSFYYENALVPSVQTDVDTYSVQIADPMENASLNVVNDQGCGFVMPLSIEVTDPSFIYSSQEFEVTGLLLSREDIRFSNTSEGEYAYAQWDFGDGSPIVQVDPGTEGTVTTHNYDFPGVFTVTLALFNQEGCSREVQQEVQIGNGYDVMFPSAFSANADGINDYFQGKFTGISSFVFEIYDMWGALIYSAAHDFDDAPANWGWDGNYSTGKPYKNTTFRYLFKGTTSDNNQITKTGEAVILR